MSSVVFFSVSRPSPFYRRRWAQITRWCYQISRRKISFSPQHVFVTHQRLKRFSFSFICCVEEQSQHKRRKQINWNLVAWRQRLKSPDPRRWNVALWNDFLLKLVKKTLLPSNLGFTNSLDQDLKISQMTTTWWSSLSQNQTPSSLCLNYDFLLSRLYIGGRVKKKRR